VREKSAARGRAPRKLPRRSLAAQHVRACVRIFLHSSFSNASFSILNKHFVDCSLLLLLLLLLLGCARGAPKTPKERCSLSCVCVCMYILARSDVFFAGGRTAGRASRFFPKRENKKFKVCFVLFSATFWRFLPQQHDATHETHDDTTPHQKNNRDHTRHEKKHI